MILRSKRTRESIKTALAMTIAYAIALSMDWDRPYWAAFVVAFCSLDLLGQSVNKAALRLLGTLLAMVVAIALISLFPQQRWLFMVFLSAYIGFCTYMMVGSKRSYFWFVGGFTAMIICFDGGGTSVNTFETAVLRLEETGLGVLVYSLVATFLWPANSSADFDKALRQLAANRLTLYRAYFGLMRNEDIDASTEQLREQAVQQQTRVDQLLEAAITDTYEVWEVRQLWRTFRRQAATLADTMERWRHAFEEVRTLDLQELLPNLPDFAAELDARFADVERLLSGQEPEYQPAEVDLSLNEAAVGALPHFHRAALTVTRNRLLQLETLSGSLLETVRDIKGFGRSTPQTDQPEQPVRGFAIDVDSVAAALRVMTGLWLAYFVWIYTLVPGGTAVVVSTGVYGMAIAVMPQVSSLVLFGPFAVAVTFASVLYIFVMPQLSTFGELGLMIFIVTFAICYIFYAPRQGLARAIGLAIFVMIAAVSNQQTYSFLHVANTALMLALVVSLLWFSASITVSPRADKAFLKLLDRFFHSGEYLLSTMGWAYDAPATRISRWRAAYHAYVVATVPRKLAVWSRSIDKRTLLGTSPDQIQAVVTSLQALSYRVQELLEARDHEQAPLLVQELVADVRAWRLVLQSGFQGLSRDLSVTASAEQLRERLSGRLRHLESRIEEVLNSAPDGEISAREGENFYRLLGAYRGVSETAVELVGVAESIDWTRWREARF